MNDFICDSDFLSSLAKINRLNILKKPFSHSKFYFSYAVRTELLISLKEGYQFARLALHFPKIVKLKKEELKEFKKIKMLGFLGKGEVQSIILAKSRSLIFLSNDKEALEFARSYNVKAMNVIDILKLLWKNKLMRKSELMKIILLLEEKDNTEFRNKHLLFE